MKDSTLELIVGVGVVLAGMVGIGYAIGTRSKMNNLCEKLDTSIDKLADDIPVDIPEKMVSKAIESAVQREVAAAVKKATDEVVAAAERDIRKEVNAEVERQYTSISDGVTDEVASRVARIDEAKLRKEVVEKAKKQINSTISWTTFWRSSMETFRMSEKSTHPLPNHFLRRLNYHEKD